MTARATEKLGVLDALVISGPPVLRTEQVDALLGSPDCRTRKGKRDKALLAVLVGGGLRVGEATRLAVANLQQTRGGRLRLTFQTSKSREVRYRTVTLPCWAAEPVTRWLEYELPAGWLFAGQLGRHLSVAGAEKVVNRYLGLVGRGDLHTHSLRHTYGSMVTRETRSIFVAQKLLGHADPRTTAKYYSAFEVSDADAAADALSASVTLISPTTRQTRGRHADVFRA
jgi:integrase/recombinase XerD